MKVTKISGVEGVPDKLSEICVFMDNGVGGM